jgi:hypothetical protein
LILALRLTISLRFGHNAHRNGGGLRHGFDLNNVVVLYGPVTTIRLEVEVPEPAVGRYR